MADTPNYLGFLAQMPKESGLQSAIESGLQTYGSLQQFQGEKQRQKLEGEKLKQAEMTTKEMPSTLERKKRTEEQMIEQNKQALSEGDIKLDALKDGYLQNHMADIAMIAAENPKLAEKDYEELKRKAKILGADTTGMPDKWGPEAAMHAKINLAKSPAAAAERKFVQEYALEKLKQTGALNVAKQKELGKKPPEDTYEEQMKKTRATQDAKFLGETLPEIASTGASMGGDLDAMEKIVMENPSSFGATALAANIPGGAHFSAPVKRFNQLVSNVKAKQLKMVPGASRGLKATLDLVSEMKVLPNDPSEAIFEKIHQLKTIDAKATEQLHFANFLAEKGVTSQAAIEESWDKFLSANTDVDKQGRYHPEAIGQWPAWFGEHPEALPGALKARMQGEAYLNAQKQRKEERTSAPPEDLVEKTKRLAAILQKNGIEVDLNDPTTPTKLMEMAEKIGVETPVVTAAPQQNFVKPVGRPTERPSRPVSVAYNDGVIPDYNKNVTPHNLLSGD